MSTNKQKVPDTSKATHLVRVLKGAIITMDALEAGVRVGRIFKAYKDVGDTNYDWHILTKRFDDSYRVNSFYFDARELEVLTQPVAKPKPVDRFATREPF